MYQVEAAGSPEVRFYMPCHIFAVFVYVVAASTDIPLICHRGLIVLRGFRPRWLFEWGLMVRWLLSWAFCGGLLT